MAPEAFPLPCPRTGLFLETSRKLNSLSLGFPSLGALWCHPEVAGLDLEQALVLPVGLGSAEFASHQDPAPESPDCWPWPGAELCCR